MTTDLEQRLRGSADWPNSKGLTIVRPDYLIEAADELARLREALGEAFETLTYIHAASECEQSRLAAKEAADKIDATLKGSRHE